MLRLFIRGKLYFLGIAALILTVSACSNIFHPPKLANQSEKAVVTITVMGSSVRTVLPNVSLEHIKKYQLLVKKGEVPHGTIDINNKNTQQTIEIEPGTWDFTLNAYDENDVVFLQGIVLEKEITLDGENDIDFFLFPLNSGHGAILINFILPASAEIRTVDITADAETDMLSEVVTLNASRESEQEFVYRRDEVPVGDYFISFKFFSGDTQWVVYSELVVVRGNVTSGKSIDLRDGGTGTPNDPWIITSAAALQSIGQEGSLYKLSHHYKQAADITLSGNWTPIGNDNNPFTGTYNGSGYTISGLTITDGSSNNQGLFGVIGAGGKVQALGLINVDITGGNNIGGVAGYNRGTVQNCYVTGYVSGATFVGGLVGMNGEDDNRDGSIIIENCYVTGNVSGAGRVGGMVGDNYGTVKNCYASGTVSGNAYVGGLVGVNENTVTNCVALNQSITRNKKDEGSTEAANENFGRVTGLGTLTNSYAWSGMTFIDGTSDPTITFPYQNAQDATPTGKDGEGLGAIIVKTQSWWRDDVGFTFDGNPWIWENGYMPRLHGEREEWPEHLKD